MNHVPVPPNLDPRIAFFDELAPRWDAMGPPPSMVMGRMESLMPQMGLAAGQDVLELGCGTGLLSGWLARCVAPGRLVSVDFSPAMLQMARLKLPGFDFRVLDICAESPGECCFDAVFCYNAFPHFRNPERALAHVAQSLRDNGRLIVAHLMSSHQLNAFHHSLDGPVHHDFLPHGECWHEMLGRHGMKPVVVVDRDDTFLVVGVKDSGQGRL